MTKAETVATRRADGGGRTYEFPLATRTTGPETGRNFAPAVLERVKSLPRETGRRDVPRGKVGNDVTRVSRDNCVPRQRGDCRSDANGERKRRGSAVIVSVCLRGAASSHRAASVFRALIPLPEPSTRYSADFRSPRYGESREAEATSHLLSLYRWLSREGRSRRRKDRPICIT